MKLSGLVRYSKVLLKGREIQTRLELSNGVCFVSLEAAVTNTNLSRTDTNWLITKKQFYRHMRVDFMWVRNITTACKKSKRRNRNPQWF